MVQQWDLVRTIGISGWVICATLKLSSRPANAGGADLPSNDQTQNRGLMVIPPGRYAISPEFDWSRML